MIARALLAAAISLSAACSALPARSPEALDERSATTLLAAARPLVFARARSDVAAHAHDYATLQALEVDRSGEYGEYLLMYRWTTVDPRMSAPPSAAPGRLQLIAEGRQIELHPEDRLPVSLDHSRLLNVPPHADAAVTAYRVDSAMLRFIADSRDLTLRLPADPLDAPFVLRQDGRRALQQFLDRAAPP
jgi:hypothetical protein